MVKEISLTQGYIALVDDDIYDYLSQWSWCTYIKEGKYIYATRSEKGRTVWMHKEILNVSSGSLVDHKDGNGLNNQRHNLREVDRARNATNRKMANTNNTSGYRNVCLISGYYRIQLQINGKNHMFSEKFTDVDDAGKFAEKMRKKYYGEYAGNG